MTGHSFDDSDPYEQFMGRWSRALSQRCLDWIGPPTTARWLDVGCGTGIFTQLILDTCSPAALSAVDPAKAQIEGACRVARRGVVQFRLADAQALPFADPSFDVVIDLEQSTWQGIRSTGGAGVDRRPLPAPMTVPCKNPRLSQG
jgi:SAM-dependent methyltransferase